MAITLDIIADKVFQETEHGYSKREVDDFLNDILDEMEAREAETEGLKKQVASLKKQLEDAETKVKEEVPVPVQNVGKRSTESFELVLTKAQGVHEEIVSDADKRAEEIVAKANEEAATIRTQAEAKITDLSDKYEGLRKQSQDYYEAFRKIVEEQNVSLEGLKKLLG